MKLKLPLLCLYIIFLVIYSLFVLIPKPAAAILHQYHLSAGALRLIDVTIVLILAGIWFAGFYGYDKLRGYSSMIKGEKDGIQMAMICRGLLMLVLWLPIASTLSAVLNYFAMQHPSFLSEATIINNYVNLLLPLVGFVLIGLGVNDISHGVRRKASYATINVFAGLLIYLGLIYYHLVISTHNRQQVYHLSVWMLLLTIIGPYIFMWFTGLVAAYRIYLYQLKVPGIVYRRSLTFLSAGLGWLIVTSIIFQFLTTLSGRLNTLSIYWILVIVYAALLTLSVGFILVAAGARKLQYIEEV